MIHFLQFPFVAGAMAYRRSIIARAKLFYQHQQQQQQRRLASSFPHLTCSDREQFPTQTISTNSEICSRFLMNGNSSVLSANVSRLMRSRIPASYGLIFHRNFSNVPSDIEDLDFNGAAGAVGDKAVEAAPAINEVAVAAADSFTPVAAFQHLIDYVHCFTGFEWFVSLYSKIFSFT